MPNSFSRAPCGPISMPPPSPPPCVSSASAIAASAQSLRCPSTDSKPGSIKWDKAPPCPDPRAARTCLPFQKRRHLPVWDRLETCGRLAIGLLTCMRIGIRRLPHCLIRLERSAAPETNGALRGLLRHGPPGFRPGQTPHSLLRALVGNRPNRRSSWGPCSSAPQLWEMQHKSAKGCLTPPAAQSPGPCASYLPTASMPRLAYPRVFGFERPIREQWPENVSGSTCRWFELLPWRHLAEGERHRRDRW